MIKEDSLFMEDEDACHSAKKTQNLLEDYYTKKLPWSSQSPDMDHIEHLWGIMDRSFRKKKKTFSNVPCSNLKSVEINEWNVARKSLRGYSSSY